MDLGITWTDDDDVGKLLGAPSGLSLSSGDVNDFLHEQICSKLMHWSVIFMNPIGRAMIVNIVLLGACYYFFSIWGGKKKGVDMIKSFMINYLPFRGIRRAHTKVGWMQCCQERSNEGINLINPKDAAVALIVKWVIKAMELGTTNLHELLRYRLIMYQPYQRGSWSLSLEFFRVVGYSSRQGSLG
jgi:hypothetical protein